MKAVTPDAFGVVAPRNGQQLRDARQVMMESRVETGDLRQLREPLVKRFGQQDFLRRMFRVKRT